MTRQSSEFRVLLERIADWEYGHIDEVVEAARRALDSEVSTQGAVGYELRIRIQGGEGHGVSGPYTLYTAHTVDADFPFMQEVGPTPEDALIALAHRLPVAEGREEPYVR